MLIKPSFRRDMMLIISLFSHTTMLPRVLQILSRANSSTNLLAAMLVSMSMLAVSSIMKDPMLLLLTILPLSLVIRRRSPEAPREFSNLDLKITSSWVSSIMVLQVSLPSLANIFTLLISSLHSRLCTLTNNTHSLSTILRLVSQVQCSWISPLTWISTPFLLPTLLSLLGLLTVDLVLSFRERTLVLALVICSLSTGLRTLMLFLTLRLTLCKNNTMLLLSLQQPHKFSNGVTCPTPVNPLVISSVEPHPHLGSANIWRISSSSIPTWLSSPSPKSSLLVSWTPEQLESNT